MSRGEIVLGPPVPRHGNTPTWETQLQPTATHAAKGEQQYVNLASTELPASLQQKVREAKLKSSTKAGKKVAHLAETTGIQLARLHYAIPAHRLPLPGDQSALLPVTSDFQPHLPSHQPYHREPATDKSDQNTVPKGVVTDHNVMQVEPGRQLSSNTDAQELKHPTDGSESELDYEDLGAALSKASAIIRNKGSGAGKEETAVTFNRVVSVPMDQFTMDVCFGGDGDIVLWCYAHNI